MSCGEYAEQVAAKYFLELFGGVAARVESSGDFGQVGCGVDAFGEGGDAVEVGADAYVVDAGDRCDVIDVVDERS